MDRGHTASLLCSVLCTLLCTLLAEDLGGSGLTLRGGLAAA